MTMTREQFDAAIPPLKSLTFTVPLVGDVTVSELTSLEAEQLDTKNYPVTPGGSTVTTALGRSARWAIATLRNPDGTPMYTDADFQRVAGLPGHIMKTIVKHAKRVNGVKADDDDADSDDPVEAAAKN